MTLSSKICVLKSGILQQYQSPLEVYNNPSNTFVADFVGNPNINFVEASGKNINGKEIKLKTKDLDLVFTPVSENIKLKDGQDLILGIRPEHISISKQGKIKARVYSTLPSGMETIVKLDTNNNVLTSVVFGGVDFKVDEQVSFNFDSDKYILFDKNSGKNLGLGKLDVTS